MKNRFKSLLTLCVFGFSFMTSVFSAEALDEISYDITNTEIQVDESEILTDDFIFESELIPDLSYYFNENTFKFYDQLDNNNKSAYDSMKIWIEPTTEEFRVSFPDTISYQTQSTDMSKWDEEQYNEFWNMIFSNILYGKNALMFDYPELFWLDNSQIKITLSNVRTSRNIFTGMYTMKISELKLQGNVKEEYTDVETAMEFKKILENAVETFEIQGTDRYQQLKYIHDYIAKTVTYNLDAPYHDASVGLFCDPYQLVCEGYSKAFKILCDKADIPCIVVPGNIDAEKNIGHMWNYVMMEDDRWYGVDCTWDDTNSESNPVKYTYFLKGSDSFNTTHTPDTEYAIAGFIYPELNTENYSYTTSIPVTAVTTNTQTKVSTFETTAVTSSYVTTIAIETTTEVSVPVTEITIVTTIPITSLSSVSTTDVTNPDHLKGDYNLDGKINVSDLVILRKVIVGIIQMNEYFPNDDLNNDNVINVFDYIILSRMILGGI